MPVQLKVSGDPRRPDEIVRYKRPVKKAEDGGDLMLVLTMILAGIGLMFKYKVAAWASVICCISAIANIKAADFDVKQIVSSISFAMMGMVGSYIQVPPPIPRVAPKV